MTSQTIPSQIEELKKGCGKEFQFKDKVNCITWDLECGIWKDLSKYNGGACFMKMELCPTCQAKLQTLQNAQEYFLEEVDERISKLKEVRTSGKSVGNRIDELEKLKSKIGGGK